MARSGGKPCWLQASCFVTADPMDGQARCLPVEPYCSKTKRQDALRGIAHGSVSFPGFGIRRGRAGPQARIGCDKFKDSWEAGIWMGRVTTTGEHIVGCPTGVLAVRSVKRRFESFQWDKGLLECMVWRPWAAQSVKAALQYRLWVPIVGCHDCEQDAAGP